LHYEQKKFYFLAAGILAAKHIMVNKIIEPEVLYFKDDGKIPTANTRFYCIAMLLKNGDIRVPNGWNNFHGAMAFLIFIIIISLISGPFRNRIQYWENRMACLLYGSNTVITFFPAL
jgi:hypothetical protein